MDALDVKILAALKKDARTPFLHIATSVGLSEGAIRQRVTKLKKSGVIKGFTVVVEGKTRAIVHIATASSVPTAKIVEKIQKLGVERVFEVTGKTTLIALIDSDNLSKLNSLIEKVRLVEGVLQTETFPVLKEHASE